MKSVIQYKKKYLKYLASIPSFKENWSAWNPDIVSLIGKKTGIEIFNLGDHLSDIIQLTKSAGRSQSGVSGAGAAWECLVTWYLNFIFYDTPVLVLKQNKKFVPDVISNCIAISISNHVANTESDVLIFNIPDSKLFKGTNVADLNDHLTPRINKVDLTILQCKTNWNDNAQIPMLWDIIYNSQSKLPHVSVGVQGVNPNSTKNFKYSFVTIPTNKINKIKSTSTCVLRVKDLTGGNFWGRKSSKGIASSIKELPSRHSSSSFSGGIPNHLQKTIKKYPDYINNFLDLSW